MAKISFTDLKRVVVPSEFFWIIPVFESLKHNGTIDEYRFAEIHWGNVFSCGIRKNKFRSAFVIYDKDRDFDINSYADREKALREMVELALQNNTSVMA